MTDVKLNVKIGGDGKQGAAAVKQVTDEVKKLEVESKKAAEVKPFTGMKESADAAKDALKNIVGLIAGAAGIDKFLELGKASLENAKALNEFSAETGVAIETLSVLQFEARKMGLDVSNLRLAFNQLSTSLKEVQQGNVATQQMFQSLGLDWRTLVGIPLDQVLLKVGSALDKFADGANKNIVGQALLGARATKLIPLLQSLAGDGFAKAATEAERLGQVMRESDVRAAEDFEARMVSLNSQVSTMSRTFLESLIPGIVQSTDALDEMTGSTQGAREAFGALGTFVGGIAKFILFVFNEVAKTAGNITFAITRRVEAVAGALAELTSGNFAAAIQEMKDGTTEINTFIAAGDKDSKALWESFFGTPQQVDEVAAKARDTAITNLAATVASLKKLGKEVEPLDLSKMSTEQIVAKNKELGKQIKQQLTLQAADQQAILKAQADSRLAALDQQLAFIKEKSSQFLAGATATFEQGRATVAEFFAARQQAIEEAGAAELRVARAKAVELQKTVTAQEKIRSDSPDAIQARTALRTAENDIQLIQLRTEGQLSQLQQERQTKNLELTNARLDFEKTLAEVQGRTFDAALIGIDQQVTEFAKQLTQIGIIGQAQANALKSFREEATGKAKVAELTTQAERLSQTIANNQEELNQQVNLGLLSQDQALAKQAQFIAAQGPAVSNLTTAFRLLKGTVTDPAIQEAIDAMILKLNGIVVAAQGAKTELQQMQQGALTAAGRSLLGFLNDLSDSSNSLGEDFANMAKSFLLAIAQMVNEILVLEAVTAVAKALGVPIPEGGFHFAQGGAVPGAGDSDSVRAMLTPGEFVLNRKMVGAFGGIEQLERLRLAMQGGTPIQRSGTSYFAEGGVVTKAPSAADQITSGVDVTRVIVEVSPDLVARQIETGPGQKAVIRSLKNNRNAAKAALGNG